MGISNVTSFGSPQIDEKTGSMKMGQNLMGVDLNDVLQKQLEVKKIPIQKKEALIDKNTQKLSALADLESKLNAFKEISHNLRSSIDYKTGLPGIFAEKKPDAYSDGPTSPESMVAVNCTQDLQTQQFNLRIDQLATYDSSHSETGISDPQSALGWSGSLTLNEEVLDIEEDQSLKDIVNNINKHTETTHMKADMLKVGDSEYRLQFQSVTLGEPMSIENDTTAPAGSIPSVSGKDEQDLSAKIHFNSQTIFRKTNDINDVVTGMTLSLKKPVPGETLTIQVKPDLDKAYASIQTFVEKYNDLKDFIQLQKERDPATQEYTENAILQNHPLLHRVETMLSTGILGQAKGLDPNQYQQLSDIGITTDDDFKLVINDSVLADALLKKFSEVEDLFAFDAVVPGDGFSVTRHPEVIPDPLAQSTTTVTVSKDADGQLEKVEFTLDDPAYEGKVFSVPIHDKNAIHTLGDTIFIHGKYAFSDDMPAQTLFNGLEVALTRVSNIPDGGSVHTTINLKQGIGDRITQSLKNYLDPYQGDLKVHKETFTNQNQKILKDIDRLNERTSRYEERLQKQYSATQAKLAEVQNISQNLDSFFNTNKK